MNAYLLIIALVLFVGMWALTESIWKGFCYSVWVIGALAFWWALAIAVGLAHLPS